ncbi:MAG TPA: phage/plasmid primase, P4 family [Flavobacteriales bacterium]|nr:phage/plasmid primase, P4 family [Flavobacteriales bacterium]
MHNPQDPTNPQPPSKSSVHLEATVGRQPDAATDEADALAAARYLASEGVPVFVARPVMVDGQWDPSGGTSKTGYHLPERWQFTKADPHVVDTWRRGDALCAVMGHTVDALDMDPRNGGAASLAALVADGVVPTSYGRQVTPSGGTHDLIPPLNVASRGDVRPGVDVKAGTADANGRGFIFIAPTVKVSKADGQLRAYSWATVPDLTGVENDGTGQALAELMREKEPQRRAVLTGLIPEATDAQRTFAQMEVVTLAEQVAGQGEGHRHDSLLRSARIAGGYAAAAQLDPEAVIETMANAGQASGLDAAEAQRTARDGVQHGALAPLTLPADGVAGRVSGEAYKHNHERFASRLAEQFAGSILWVTGLGWFYYDGQRWASDPDNAVPKQCVSEVLEQALEDAEASGSRELATEVKRAQTATGFRGILDIAASKPQLRAAPEQMDTDPWLLNVRNGTVDLHTGELHPHRPEDRITKITRAAWQPEAASLDWDQFLSSSLPDPAVRDFLQRAVGVALVGQVYEHKLVINTGQGRNGKGVFSEAVTFALGDYASTADPAMFLQDPRHPVRSAGTDAKLLRLRGVRAAFMSEIQRNAVLNESVMKTLTGGDRIEAKKMYGNPVEFTPSHSFFVAANDLPRVDADARAVWARMLVVPWDVSFVGREDRDLGDRLRLAAEAVLAWAWRGLQDWDLLRDLVPPPAVTRMTDTYRHDNDPIQDFLDEACVADPRGWVKDAELKEAYSNWALRNGRRDAPPARELVKRLEARGVLAATRRGARGRSALRLADSFDVLPAGEDLL